MIVSTHTVGREGGAVVAALLAASCVRKKIIEYRVGTLHNPIVIDGECTVALTPEEERLRRQRYYAERTPEEIARYKAKAAEWHAKRRDERIAERAARGIGRYQQGPPKTAEEIAAHRALRAERARERRLENLERSRELERIKARRSAAAKLEAAGLEAPDVLRPKAPLLTEEEKRERRRVKSAAWRAANRDRSREIVRESMKRMAAEKAVAEGREPGKRGRPKLFTEEERRAKRKAKTVKHTAAHLAEVREKARLREAAKRAGTFVSRARPRLTEEQRRLVGAAMTANRRARVVKNGGTFSRADIEMLYAEQRGRCLFCRDHLASEMHIDHWIPIVRGGSNGPENLALLHEGCNLRKGAKMPSEFGFPDDPALVRAALIDSSPPVPEGDP